jgi:hypothetical protein
MANRASLGTGAEDLFPARRPDLGPGAGNRGAFQSRIRSEFGGSGLQFANGGCEAGYSGFSEVAMRLAAPKSRCEGVLDRNAVTGLYSIRAGNI